MKFDILGKKENPAILMIHGMFCNSDSVKYFAKYLQEDYFIIIPTLNGHYIGANHYVSKENEAKEILCYLHEKGIKKLALLQGTSMGAEIALEFARISDIPIEHYFYDGGPFFNFPACVKVIMKKKFQRFVTICKGKSGEEAFEALMMNGFVKLLMGNNKESYRTMIMDFANVCPGISDTTIQNVVETCYACKLPYFDDDVQRKFLFFFSEKEPAHLSKKRLMKVYQFAKFKDVPNLKHCGFQVTKPKDYADYLNSVIKS